MRRPVRQWLLGVRRLSVSDRALPDFLIVGAKKAGTKSLLHYLSQHPDVAKPWFPEVRYFDLNWYRGRRWYQAHFPAEADRGKTFTLTGEATPDYFACPWVAPRVRAVVPNARIIVLLRDPVSRTISHWCHERRHGHETLPIEEALEAEDDRLRDARERRAEDPTYYDFNDYHFSYRSRSIYLEHLKAWTSEFPADQILIIKSEAMFQNPRAVLLRTEKFLGLPEREADDYMNINPGVKRKVPESVREKLRDFFRPHNRRLYDYLGVEWDWDAAPRREEAARPMTEPTLSPDGLFNWVTGSPETPEVSRPAKLPRPQIVAPELEAR